MKSAARRRRERRAHVICPLPANDEPQAAAADRAFEVLLGHRQAQLHGGGAWGGHGSGRIRWTRAATVVTRWRLLRGPLLMMHRARGTGAMRARAFHRIARTLGRGVDSAARGDRRS